MRCLPFPSTTEARPGSMLLLALGLLAALPGCADDKGEDGSDEPTTFEDTQGGGDEEDQSCESDDDCIAFIEICEAGSCVDGDRDNSEDTANTLRFGDPSDTSSWSEGAIFPAGDVDWHAFESAGGEFVRVSTYTDEGNAEHNTVVSIYRNNGKLVTVADGHAAGGGLSSTDAAAYAYLSEAGTYLVKVEDADPYWGTDTAYGARDYSYQLLLQEWTANTSEPDGLDTPSTGIELTATNTWSARGVLIDEPGDTDWVQIRVSAPDMALVIDGNFELSGSEARPRARLLDGEGQLWSDRIDFGVDGIAYVPAIPEGDYFLELSDADGGGSENHWFFVHSIGRDQSSTYGYESEDNGPDGVPDALDQEELETDSGNLYTIARVEGLADAPGDEDRFSFRSDFDDGRIVVCLLSGYYGSTALPELEVVDDEGTVLGSVSADATGYPTAELDNLPAPTGDYTLRVLHGEDSLGQPSDWYRLFVYVASFEVTSWDCPS